MRSSDIRRELGTEPLLLCVERSQLRWLGDLIRMPPGCLPLEVFWARPTRRRPWDRPRICWRDYISHCGLGTPLDPPAGPTKLFLGEGHVENPAGTATRPQISQINWMKGIEIRVISRTGMEIDSFVQLAV